MATQSQFAKLTQKVTTKIDNGTATNADFEEVIALGVQYGGAPGLRGTYKKFWDSLLPNGGREPLDHLSNAEFRQLQRKYFK